MFNQSYIQELEEKLLNPKVDLSDLTAERQYEIIMAKVADMSEAVVTPEDLLERLKKSKQTGIPLKVKFGIDPTGPNIHIGHAVPLLRLRLFQRMGHQICIIIGDFTAMIGDPSGRMDDRPALSEEDVKNNMATYEEQAARVIDLKASSIKKHYNSAWMNQIGMAQWIQILKKVSLSSLLQREDFRKRISNGFGLSLAEVEYALFMGYDSVVLKPDIEIGGLDQFLNMHMCRQMMAVHEQKPEIIVTNNILAGTTGERDEAGRFVKMSKSRGNYIPVTAEPYDMYGKVMSIPDEVMWLWFRELTEITSEELSKLASGVQDGYLHPKQVKQLLARVVVGIFNYFDRQVILKAQADFDSKFGKNSSALPDNLKEIAGGQTKSLVTVFSEDLGLSKSELFRMAKQNGIKFFKNEEYFRFKEADLHLPSTDFIDFVFKVGKKVFVKIVS